LLRKLLKILGISLLIIGMMMVVAVFLANRHLASNKTKILDQLSFLNEGIISFDETSISLYKNFPEATITLNNVWVKDSLFDQHQQALLQVEKLHGAFSILDIWAKEVEINEVQLENGVINIFTQQNGYSNVKNLLKKQLNPTLKKEKDTSWTSIDLKTKALGLSLSNIQVNLTNAIKTTDIHAKINHLSTLLDLEKADLAAQIKLDIGIDHLIFKKEKGAFLPNSQLQGTFDFIWKDSSVVIQPFDLQINEEVFLFSGEFYTIGDSPSTLFFENQVTRLAKISPLLIPNIQKVLAPYDIPAPFFSKTKLITTFHPEDHPIIEVDFQFQNQAVTVFEIPFKQTTVSGNFLNRIYRDERQASEGKKRFSLNLERLSTQQGQFHIQAEKAYAWKTPEQGTRLKSVADISGKAKGISDWLGNNQFIFDEGTFKLTAAINGSLQDINSIISETDADLKLQDFTVVYQPANVRFPFREMTLEKEAGAASFSLVNSSFQQELWLHGNLKNIPALLIALANQKANGQVKIQSKKLTWTDFVNFFAENGLSTSGKKSEREKKKSMKTTVKGLYRNFEPVIAIEIDTLAYFDLLQLENFKTGLHFENEHTLILEKTSFDYDGGEVIFKGKLDISQPHRTPFEFELTTSKLNLAKALPTLNYLNINVLKDLEQLPDDLNLKIQHKGILDDEKGLVPNSSTGKIAFDSHNSKDLFGTIIYQPDTTINLEATEKNAFGVVHIDLAGNPKVFNSFFKTDQFFFKDGQFKVAFDYKGNIKNFKELLSDADAVFSLKESEVYYQPVGVTFPLTEIDLKLEADKANFDFYLLSDSLREKIHLSGNIDHISELLLGRERDDLSSVVNIAAPKLTWGHFLSIFASSNDSTDETESMKATVKGILQTFNPHFHVQVDSFVYSNQVVFEALNTGVHLRDSATIILEETNFDFHNGHILVDGQFDLGQKLITPFAASIQTENLVLKELIESLNYLSLPSLKNMTKLGGAVSMDFDLSGVIDDYQSSLIPNSTKGTLAFDLQLGN